MIKRLYTIDHTKNIIFLSKILSFLSTVVIKRQQHHHDNESSNTFLTHPHYATAANKILNTPFTAVHWKTWFPAAEGDSANIVVSQEPRARWFRSRCCRSAARNCTESWLRIQGGGGEELIVMHCQNYCGASVLWHDCCDHCSVGSVAFAA